MYSKNSAPIKPAERAHLEWVKTQSCVVCGAPPPCDAHHIVQGDHYTCLPLCRDCHMGSLNGIHGRKTMWNIMKKTELSCLNEVIARLAA